MNTCASKLFRVLILLVLFVVFTLGVCLYDVCPIGPQGSQIGFAHVNEAVFSLLGQSSFWYALTKGIGLVAILALGLWACLGLSQLIGRKSLAKIDRPLWALVGAMVLVGALYVFFEIVIVNYRPVLTDGVLEASYPSSHTMLGVCVFLLSTVLIPKYISSPVLAKLLQALAVGMAVITPVGRLLSGVHWFTDIVGALLLSAVVIGVYYLLLAILEK